MNRHPTSTPSKRAVHSTKYIKSDESSPRPPSHHTQEELKAAVGHELEGHTWQFNTERFAKVMSPKRCRFPLEPHQVDKLDHYDDFPISDDTLGKAMESLKSTAKLPTSNSEGDHCPALCAFLNDCVEACHQALGDRKGKYYANLKFIVWDLPMADGVAGSKPLKPDLVGGQRLQGRETTKATGLYWRRPGSLGYELLIPVEVKEGWPELVRQAGTYARCLVSASPLRQFALVLGYHHVAQEFRFLLFHHGGVTSSLALKPNSQAGQRDILHIFLAILSWETPAHAGIPMWCNDGEMELPAGTTADSKGIRVQVKKVLHDSLSLRGRGPRVVSVSAPDASQLTLPPPNALIPAAESTCFGALRCSERLITKGKQPKEEGVANQHASGSRGVAVFGRTRGSRPQTSLQGGNEEPAGGSRSQTSPHGGNEEPTALIAIPQHDDELPIRYVKHKFFDPSSNNAKDLHLAAPGVVVKSSWVSTQSIEPDLLRDCNGLFGTPTHYYSFLAYHGDNSPATNHLFLPPPDEDLAVYHWDLFQDYKIPRNPDFRALLAHVCAYAGHSLVTAGNPKELLRAGFHACLGWFNMMQKGYLHRDISIGNIVMQDDDVQTRAFEIIKVGKTKGEDVTVEDITKALEALNIGSSTPWENKLVTTLQELGVTDKCCGFVIDGDMAIKIADYFTKEHVGSRSGTYEFMSIGLLEAADLRIGYLQSPVDDLFSHYYTMQWAAAFNANQPAAAEEVPIRLVALRNKLSGNADERTSGTTTITYPAELDVDDFGEFLVLCQPFLQDWHSSLLALDAEWKKSQNQLKKLQPKVPGPVYISLFSTFAVKGVAQLAELVHRHTAKMEN